jgi:hypothetical protein
MDAASSPDIDGEAQFRGHFAEMDTGLARLENARLGAV